MSPDSRPVIDVVMCTYNSASSLPAVLDGVAGLNEVFDLRLIVIDNDSKDESEGLVRAHTATTTDFVQTGENAGFGVAINRGLDDVRPESEAVLVLNPDVVLGPGADYLRLFHELTGSTGVVTPKLVRADGSVDHACARPEPTPLQTLVYAGGLTKIAARLRPQKHWYGRVPDHAGPIDTCSGAFMLMRKDALEQVGQLDTQFWMYAEDIDWCRRFRVAGFTVQYEPAVRALHVKGESTKGAWSGPTLFWFFESMSKYYAKWYSDSLLGKLGLLPLRIGLSVWKRVVSRRDGKRTQLW